tara:strand:+ start:252 stop:1649 length:1398 start_codon:yes stop_codon:yes gene_type:complete
VDTIQGPQPVRRFDEWTRALHAPDSIILPIAGEGSGKSLHAGLVLSAHIVYDLRLLGEGHLYWVVGADFEDARKDFDYFVSFQEQLDNIQDLSRPSHRDQQCTLVTKTGQTIVTISSYDVTKIAREEPLGIIGAEVSRWYQETFERCEGRLIRNYPYSWMYASGSPESSYGWLPDLAKFAEGPNDRAVRTFYIPSWCNLAKYPGGREDPAIKRVEAGRSKEKFDERFGARFTPSKRLVCHNFRTNLHVDYQLEYDPDFPVYVGIDPGGVVYAIEFVQFTGDGEVHVLDEIYVHRWTHQDVINEFHGRVLSAVTEGGAIDVASKQPQNAMPISFNEWHKDTGLVLWAEKHAVDDTVDKLCWALSPNPNTGRPRLRVRPHCTGIISEMGGCPSPVPDGGPWMRHEYRDGIGPPMRKNDHACKALGYVMMGPYGLQAAERSLEAAEPVSYLGASRAADAASYLRGARG